jgi:hypothetical protein
MRVSQKRLTALGCPLDRPANALGGPSQRDIFGVQKNLRTETAAYVRRNHPHLALGQAKHKGAHQQALDVRILVGDMQGVAVVVLGVGGDGCARLHRVGDQAVVGK